jgi:hypothetical protein
MNSRKVIDFAARFEYLTAIEGQQPTVLTDLQTKIFPAYQECRRGLYNTTALQNLAQLSEAVHSGSGLAYKALADKLEEWAVAHKFLDMWLQDAGIQTLFGWFQSENIDRWRYFPDELDAPRLQVKFGQWIPSKTRWREFKKISDQIYRSRLLEYRAEGRRRWGEGNTKFQQHAAWTVKWQRGKSPEAIQIWHFHNTGKKVSRTAIQLAVHSFADAAGITLRKPKAGRGAKKINVRAAEAPSAYILTLLDTAACEDAARLKDRAVRALQRERLEPKLTD